MILIRLRVIRMMLNRVALLSAICAAVISCAPSVGIIKDSKTGLQWVPAIDKDTSWYEARDYVSRLRVSGFSDWRLPSRSEELQGLYNSSIDPKRLNLSGKWVLVSEIEEPSYAWAVSFYDSLSITDSLTNSYQNRSLAVRWPNK